MGREDYRQIQSDRIDRMQSRAEKAEEASQSAYETSRKLADQIPFGQPILVGHHSEKRHQRHIEKIQNYATQSVELSRKADKLRSRAASAESNRMTSSDDPDAIEALQEKLKGLEKVQERMKAVNKIIAAKPKNQQTTEKIEQLIALGLSEKSAILAFEPDFLGRYGFASFELSNNNAKIRSVKVRIEQLQKSASLKYEKIIHDGFSVILDPSLNRVQIDFESVAKYRELCTQKGINLRRYGFVFSRRDGNCWQRKITGNAVFAVRQVVKILTGEDQQ
jgi:hypothetical protein